MIRSRTIRTFLAFMLLTAIFICGCSAALVTISSAQESGKQAGSEPGEESGKGSTEKETTQTGKESEAEEDEIDETPDAEPTIPEKDLTPTGPDELFTPLPDDGIFAGTVPSQMWKAVVLTVPNAESPNDFPQADLPSNASYSAEGLLLMLGQQLEYLPQIHTETNQERTRRYAALLRSGDAPRADSGAELGQRSVSLDLAADAFNADIVFAVSFVPGEGEAPSIGAAYRYEKTGGIIRSVHWQFGKLATPEPDSMVALLESRVNELCAGIGATKDEAGNTHQVPHAPIPRLAADDKAMREFVKLQRGLEAGEPAKAWIAFDSLMKRDPRCGRAALFGMEVFRALSSSQSSHEESAKYLERAVEVGRAGVALAQNDVLLRGRLCWIATSHFNRFEWAQAGLKQARRVQPANFELIGWWMTCYEVADREKQAQWLIEHALPIIKDGRIELILGNTYYGGGNYAKGVEWYLKGVEIAPLDHELQMSLGLCANYLGESMAKQRKREESSDAFAISTEALAAAQDIDPQAMRWVYEYYVRACTHKFKRLPTNPNTLERLFLTQAALTGLTSNSRTGEWDRLVVDVIRLQRDLVQDLCREAQPDDSLYTMKLIARLQFDLVEDDPDDLVYTLWLMKNAGLRPEIYTNLMLTYGPLVNDYKPPQDDDEQG
ncbi:MAG: hypothetical protein R3E76_12890 [Planctomycetota bacterium]